MGWMLRWGRARILIALGFHEVGHFHAHGHGHGLGHVTQAVGPWTVLDVNGTDLKIAGHGNGLDDDNHVCVVQAGHTENRW